MRCPSCGHETEPATGIARHDGSFDVAVRRLGQVTFDSPVRLTRSGLYVAGHNEDGRPILTRAADARS